MGKIGTAANLFRFLKHDDFPTGQLGIFDRCYHTAASTACNYQIAVFSQSFMRLNGLWFLIVDDCAYRTDLYAMAALSTFVRIDHIVNPFKMNS